MNRRKLVRLVICPPRRSHRLRPAIRSHCYILEHEDGAVMPNLRAKLAPERFTLTGPMVG